MTRSWIIALLALAGAVPAARAQRPNPEPKPLVVTVENRTAVAETPKRGDAGARPGDVLRYHLAFTNLTGKPIRQVVLADPIPAGLKMSGGSTHASRPDARVEYSADGGRTYSAQPMEQVVVDGRTIQRPVPPERYTHVRWTVEGWVAPAATVTAEFEAHMPAQRGAGARTPGSGSSGR